MGELKKEMGRLGFDNVETLLNSGNILFDGEKGDSTRIEGTITEHLKKVFGFSIPTLVRTTDFIMELLNDDPFKGIVVTKDIRLYVSFLQTDMNIESDLQLPWRSDDGSYKIIGKKSKTVLSVLDLAIGGTPKAMEAVERFFGKDVTTRNWKTIKRIEKKLLASR